MKKTTVLLRLLAMEATMCIVLLGGCGVPGATGVRGSVDGVLSVGCPGCPDVGRVGEVSSPLNPEPENLAVRSINVVVFKGRLFAIYLNLSSNIAADRWFQVYVSAHGCGDEWTRTNQGNALNVNKQGIQYAAYSIPRLIEYNCRLYAFWQEKYGLGNIMHVKRYNECLDVWERVDDQGEAGLSGYYVSQPNAVNHWAYFYHAGATVYNKELYVSWGQLIGEAGELAVLKYDGNGWSKVDRLQMPGQAAWGHGWVSLAVFDDKLTVASVTKKDDEDKRGFLEVYQYDNAAGAWTKISNRINTNIYDSPATPSLITVNNTLYIAWREITNSSLEYDALPYRIYVKAYQGGDVWEFVGANPLAKNPVFSPILLEYKNRLTIVYGDAFIGYIKQLEGTTWMEFPAGQTGPFIKDIAAVGKFPTLDVFSAVSGNDKIYFAWRTRTDADRYFCGLVDDTTGP